MSEFDEEVDQPGGSVFQPSSGQAFATTIIPLRDLADQQRGELQRVGPMAVVVDVEDLDLVVESHAYTDADREAFRCAVQQDRQRSAHARTIEEAARMLARRMKDRRGPPSEHL